MTTDSNSKQTKTTTTTFYNRATGAPSVMDTIHITGPITRGSQIVMPNSKIPKPYPIMPSHM